MQSVVRCTSGRSLGQFWRTAVCINTFAPAAGGGCSSRETVNASDNPNKGSRIIPCPRWRRESGREQILRGPNFRSVVFVSRWTGTDPVPSDCGDMEKKAKSIGVMTSDQAIQLRQLAFDAYEPDAFRPNLTRTEGERRIAALQAKLRLMDDPPHVQ